MQASDQTHSAGFWRTCFEMVPYNPLKRVNNYLIRKLYASYESTKKIGQFM